MGIHLYRYVNFFASILGNNNFSLNISDDFEHVLKRACDVGVQKVS